MSSAVHHHLFAMMPLFQEEVFLCLAFLALLILGTRGKSLLAHGAFAGMFLGYLVSAWEGKDSRWNYPDRDLVALGLIVGSLIAGAIRIYVNTSKPPQSDENNPPADQPAKPNPFFWSAAFAVSGAYLAMFAAVYLRMPFDPGISMIMGAILAGTLAGLVFGPLLLNHPRISKSFEFGMGIILLAGIGFIFVWKIF